VKVSSFEECFALGYWIQSTYPRQCITNNGEIFTEAFEEGVIYSRTYGSTTSDEKGRSITSTRDGGHLITGWSNFACWVLKVDALGEIEWESSFEQELRQQLHLSNTSFSCWLARQTSDGGYMLMGEGYDWMGLVQKPFFILTLDNEGNWVSGQVIAEKAGKIPFLDRDGNLIQLTSAGIPGEVTEAIDGGYMIAGKYTENSPDSSIHMIKTDENGNYVWDRNLCLDKNIQQASDEDVICSYNHVLDVIQLQDGSFVITGIDNGAWSIKTDVNGNIEWIQTYPPEAGGSRYGYALIPSPDGGYLMSGGGTLSKMDSAGNTQWSRTYRGGAFTAIEQRPNGEITIMGRISFPGSDDLWLLAIDSTILK